jgi:hypothetical protein
MESLDFVYDLIEGMEEQNMDYFVVAIRKGEEETKADIFYKLEDEDSIKVFETVVGNVDVRNPESTDDDTE